MTRFRRRKATAVRPCIETLECRTVPSTVTNLNDVGSGSLRQAILDTPAGGTVDFQPGLTGTITLTSGELALDKDLTIAGPGASVITVSGNHAFRVFNIAATPTVTISGLTIADGKPPNFGHGSAVENAGTLTVSNSILSGNSASGAFGGGIDNTGTLTVLNSTITGNDAGAGGAIANRGSAMATVIGSAITGNGTNFDGGGILNSGTLTVMGSLVRGNNAGGGNGGGIYNEGTAAIMDSTISGNLSEGAGGGILNNPFNGVQLTVSRSTITGNFAATHGSGIANQATLTITESTLSGNLGEGISNYQGLATIIGCTISSNHDVEIEILGGETRTRNTILAGTASGYPDVAGSLTSQGHNLIGNGTGGSGYDPSDLVGSADNPIDPLLGPLQDNGGPTQTMALLPRSPALNAGDPTQLGVPDQRGVVRSGGVSIGAYQASATAFVLTAPAKVTAGVPFDLTVTAVDPFGQLAAGYTGTVTFSTSDPDPGVVLPADYAFTAADAGFHTFSDTGQGETTLVTRGDQSIAAADTADGSIMGSAAVKVRHLRRHDGGSPGLPAGLEVASADRVFATIGEEDVRFLLPSPHHRNGETRLSGVDSVV